MRPCPGITPFDAREPYPEWHGIQFLEGDGVGNYNAFSAKLTQRFGSSLTTLFSYTWSKALDENSAIRGTGDDFTPRTRAAVPATTARPASTFRTVS